MGDNLAFPEEERDLDKKTEDMILDISRKICLIKSKFEKISIDIKIWGVLADLYTLRTELLGTHQIGHPEVMKAAPTLDDLDLSMKEYEYGYTAFKDGKFDDAKNFFNKSIKILPWNILSRINLGNLYYIEGNHEKARETFLGSLPFSKGRARGEILTNLGMNEIIIKNDEKAAEYLVEAVNLDPRNSYALNNLGLIKESQGYLDEAAEYFKEAVKANPDDGELWYNLGTILGKLGLKSQRFYAFMKAEQLGLTELTDMIDDLSNQDVKPENPLL